MPEFTSEPLQLTVRIYRAEIAKFMQSRPDAYFRVRFAGASPPPPASAAPGSLEEEGLSTRRMKTQRRPVGC